VRRHLPEILIALAFLVGIGLIAAGAGLIYFPVGLIAAGAEITLGAYAAAYIRARGGKRR
jgi:hypothetical protein